ncbi:MAG: hypothetical protein HYW50_03695 [Candidatus Diapherotrites archaeon]|nr:hypothetical protein [Candidatus Diapherotrites archaeon]
MDTITVVVNDKEEQNFRKAAKLVFGSGKGKLGKAATAALGQWAQRQTKGNEAKMLELLEKGFKMGRIKYKFREELHER